MKLTLQIISTKIYELSLQSLMGSSSHPGEAGFRFFTSSTRSHIEKDKQFEQVEVLLSSVKNLSQLVGLLKLLFNFVPTLEKHPLGASAISPSSARTTSFKDGSVQFGFLTVCPSISLIISKDFLCNFHMR